MNMIPPTDRSPEEIYAELWKLRLEFPSDDSAAQHVTRWRRMAELWRQLMTHAGLAGTPEWCLAAFRAAVIDAEHQAIEWVCLTAESDREYTETAPTSDATRDGR